MNRRPTRVVTDRPVTTRPLATAVQGAPRASSVLASTPCASHVAKRRAVARVRIDDACGARWPHEGRLSGMPIESACGGAVGTAGARSMRDRGPRGTSRSRVTDRASSSDGAASAAVLPATHAPFGIARAGSSLCLSGIPGEGLCDEAQRTADPAPASPGMPPQLRGVTGRRAWARSRTAPSSCRRAAVLPGLPLQCAYRTPRPGISTRGPARGLARITPEGGTACLNRQRDPNACPVG
jgi:hypothetical protein